MLFQLVLIRQGCFLLRCKFIGLFLRLEPQQEQLSRESLTKIENLFQKIIYGHPLKSQVGKYQKSSTQDQNATSNVKHNIYFLFHSMKAYRDFFVYSGLRRRSHKTLEVVDQIR